MPCAWPVRWCQAADQAVELAAQHAELLVGAQLRDGVDRGRRRRLLLAAPLALARVQQLAHLVGLEQPGDAEEVHLLLRADVHLAGVAELPPS